MERLEKYVRLMADLSTSDNHASPEALYRLNRCLEMELMLGECEIGSWSRQIQLIEEKINYVKQLQEASSQAHSQQSLVEHIQEQEQSLAQQNVCTFPQCSVSFPKTSSLRCHEWLCHRQSAWTGPLKLELCSDYEQDK